MSSLPSTLGQYQIIREIARSNDIVYEAYDPLMNRRVAVKELAMPAGTNPGQQEDRINRFKREAQAAGTLNHPNIMTVYSFAEDAGRTFMAMEYLDGQTLRNELDTRGAIPTDKAVEIAVSVLAGLEHAHSKGVIHRDIKPDNIQILSSGTIKITDFGIARLTFQPNLTMDGQVFGTPSYMSPEQVVGREIDARSDLFSVGVMLYEMLAGQKPFPGDSVVTITYAIMNKEPDQPSQIPWPLWQIIHRSLEKSPAMRYASAAEMKAALEEAVRPDSAHGMPIVDSTGAYAQTMNPYGAPPASPFGVTPPPAPYNPYSPAPSSSPYVQPGAASNPYTGQYGQPTPPPIAGPIQYPYNPYQAGGGAFPPHTPGMVGQTPLPIYYPPPPRQPLLKAETVVFFKKLAITILIVGALFALLLVGFQALTTEIAKAGAARDRTNARAALEGLDKTGASIDEQIDRWEQFKRNAGPNADTSEEDQALGRLYEKKAATDVQARDYANAELHIGQAVDHDKHNPGLWRDQGNIFADRANASTDWSGRSQLFGLSANAFRQAADQDTDPLQKAKDGHDFALAAYQSASAALQSADTILMGDARRQLEAAESYAADDRTLTAQIQDLLGKLSGS